MSKVIEALDAADLSYKDDRLSRRQKRTERNKVRTFRHVEKLLETFQENVLLGFSNENWSEIMSVYRQLSPFLTPSEYNSLGCVWRETWTNEPVRESVVALIEAVRTRIDKEDMF